MWRGSCVLTTGGEVYELTDRDARTQKRKATGLASAWKFQAGPSGRASIMLTLLPRCSGHFPPRGNREKRVKALFAVTESLPRLSQHPSPCPPSSQGTPALSRAHAQVGGPRAGM